jgi:hypothetical protein
MYCFMCCTAGWPPPSCRVAVVCRPMRSYMLFYVQLCVALCAVICYFMCSYMLLYAQLYVVLCPFICCLHITGSIRSHMTLSLYVQLYVAVSFFKLQYRCPGSVAAEHSRAQQLAHPSRASLPVLHFLWKQYRGMIGLDHTDPGPYGLCV